MTPDQLRGRERHAALMAVAHALTAAEREQFVAKVWLWPGMAGADVADILDLTVEHDEFLDKTEPFYAQLAPGAVPAGPALIFALHALIILDQRLTLSRVLKLLFRAGVLDTEYEAAVRNIVVEEVADDMSRAWDLSYCTEPNTPKITANQALLMARHAMSRLHTIRERDHIDPLS
jgi:hypothetical protein